MWSKMSLVLGQNLGLRLLSSKSVTKWCVNDNFLPDGSIVELDGKGIRDGAEVLIVVILSELRILNTLDLLAEGFHEWGGSRFATVGVIGCFEAAVDKHDGGHVLDAVIAIGEVVHWLELFVDDANAGFVGAAGDFFNIGGGFALFLELEVDGFCGFDSGLGVEFSWKMLVNFINEKEGNLPGYETLNKTFSIT